MEDQLTNPADKPERAYYTMLPNIILEMGLSAHALALYFAIKRTAGEDGFCWKGTRALARESGMSMGSVSKAKDELQKKRAELGEKPLIVVQHLTGAGAGNHSIAVTDIWTENMDGRSVGERQRSTDERQRSRAERQRSTGERQTEERSADERQRSTGERQRSRAERQRSRAEHKNNPEEKHKNPEEPQARVRAHTREAAFEPPIPPTISEDLKKRLAEWLAYKAERGHRYKPRGWAAFLGSIDRFGEGAVLAAILQAMQNGWQGIFPERHVTSGVPERSNFSPQKKEARPAESEESALIAILREWYPELDLLDGWAGVDARLQKRAVEELKKRKAAAGGEEVAA